MENTVPSATTWTAKGQIGIQDTYSRNHTHFDCTTPPGLDLVSSIRIQSHNPVVGDADDLIPLVAHEANHEHGLTVVAEVLPGLDVLQLGFQEWKVLHVRMAF